MPVFRFHHTRLRALLIVLVAVLAFFTVVRLGLAVFNADGSLSGLALLVPAVLLGVLYDLPVGLWWVFPLALLVALWPAGPRGSRSLPWAAAPLAIALIAGLAFVGVSEFVFWNEFESRFNFIAVDYLIYTREVIGNLQESYPLPLLFGLVALAAAFVCAAIAKPFLRALALPAGTRAGRATALAILALAATGLVDRDWGGPLLTERHALGERQGQQPGGKTPSGQSQGGAVDPRLRSPA